MIVDGKQMASDMLARAKARAEKLPHPPKVLFYAPLKTHATQSYLKIKTRSAVAAGCVFEETDTPTSFEDADAGIVQLPLPTAANTIEILNSISIAKDADVLSSLSREKFEKGEVGALLPPVVAAIREIISSQKVELKGKNAVVVGEGWLVGRPAAIWLAQQGAAVKTITEKSSDFAALLGAADVIVSGAGSAHLIKPDMIKDGVVLIDAGTSESGGALAGDADPSCAPKCSVFTPVPGGLGPIAVACLFDNAVTLAERAVL